MGAANLNPLDELKSLDRQVDLVTQLEGLKPIFYRLDEIAKENPGEFEVQLVVGDIKQHLVNRGTKLKEQQPPAAAPPPIQAAKPPAAPPPMPPAAPPPMPEVKPTVKLMSSGQYPKTPPAPPIPPSRPPLPPEPPRVAPPVVVPPPIAPVQPTARLSTPVPPPIMPPGPPSVAPPTLVQPSSQPPTPTPSQSLPPQKPPPRSPVPWKRALMLGALAGFILALAGAAFLINQARKRNIKPPAPVVAMVQVDIATTPPGAAVKVTSGQPNGETPCTSNCALTLAPGDYQVTAFLNGYEPATSALTVVAGTPASVNIPLQAQAQSVRILTDLDQGKVAFDDQPPADLQEGQFILDKVAPGPHTVKVTGKTGDATFTFEIADAKLPAITGAVAARNLIAVLVSSLGTQARVVTNSGPLKLTLNGQSQGDASPAGIDLKDFQAGVDELLVGDGKDQRNMKESFGPAPMLTAFLKSDLNIGTLIVSTGEDDVRVFLDGKEYRKRTARGQLRIPIIGTHAVRVTKDGFQMEPPQTAEVKKGAEVRLEFKLKAAQAQLATLQIRGAPPGTEVFMDMNPLGSVGADGNFSFNMMPPGDHAIDLKHNQMQPKKLQRTFRAGQTIILSGADVALAAAAAGMGTVRLARTPADATVTYRRNDETQAHEARGGQIELPAGNYVFTARAPGHADRTERVQVAAGETRSVDLTLSRERVATAPAVKAGDISAFEDPWKQEGELWVHKGGGFVPYKLGPKGTYSFTVQLIKGGVFRGRIRWCVQYVDAKNYQLFELDKKNFWAEVIENGKKLERAKIEHKAPDKQKSYAIQIEVTADHVVHKMLVNGQWQLLDTFSEPGRNPTSGKFGFLIQGSDEIGITDFSFQPK